MRILLVGPAASRAKLRARLDGTGIEIAGEFASMSAARAAASHADGILAAVDGDTVRMETDATDGEGPSLVASGFSRTDWIQERLTAREVEVLELLAEG